MTEEPTRLADATDPHVDLEFTGNVWYWRGPSPYHFVTVPDVESAYLHEMAPMVSYGWGMIPVLAQLASTEWETSLYPKNGGYVVPVKDAVRRAESIDVDDTVSVRLTLARRR